MRRVLAPVLLAHWPPSVHIVPVPVHSTHFALPPAKASNRSSWLIGRLPCGHGQEHGRDESIAAAALLMAVGGGEQMPLCLFQRGAESGIRGRLQGRGEVLLEGVGAAHTGLCLVWLGRGQLVTGREVKVSIAVRGVLLN